MAGGGLLVDGAGARAAWGVAGAVYLVSTLLALVLTRPSADARTSRTAEHAGLERIRTLMTEIDETRRREQENDLSDVALAPPERETWTGS